MGVSTTAILRKGVMAEMIAQALSDKGYENVSIYGRDKDFLHILFKKDDVHRNMMVSFSNFCEAENGISGVSCSLGGNELGIEVMRYLCEFFGGYFRESDCGDAAFEPINFDLYVQGSELSEIDCFKHEVIVLLGYENLKKAIDLFEKYCLLIKK